MVNPKNLRLYNYVKYLADKKFGKQTGVHKSSWIIRKYKKLGGLFEGSRPSKKTGIQSWYSSNAGSPQYRGKVSSIMVKVPSSVKKWAKHAFELKRLGFRGATETGWKRAKQLSERETIPIEDLRYMRNWYARHIITSYPSFRVWKMYGMPKTEMWHNRRGIISWITWGADAGLKWVNSKKTIDLLNKHFNKNYTEIKL